MCVWIGKWFFQEEVHLDNRGWKNWEKGWNRREISWEQERMLKLKKWIHIGKDRSETEYKFAVPSFDRHSGSSVRHMSDASTTRLSCSYCSPTQDRPTQSRQPTAPHQPDMDSDPEDGVSSSMTTRRWRRVAEGPPSGQTVLHLQTTRPLGQGLFPACRGRWPRRSFPVPTGGLTQGQDACGTDACRQPRGWYTHIQTHMIHNLFAIKRCAWMHTRISAKKTSFANMIRSHNKSQ